MDYILAGLVTAGALLILARVLEKTGFSLWWALLFLVPGINVIGLWVLAFVRWPALDKTPAND